MHIILQAAAITPTFCFGFFCFGGFFLGGGVTFQAWNKEKAGIKKKEKKERNPSLGCLTLSTQVCLYAPLFLISVSGAFFPSRVVIPSPASLPSEISSNSSHLSHRLLLAAALQAQKSGHQAGAACNQTRVCLPIWPLSCVPSTLLLVGFSSPPLLPTWQPGEAPSLTLANAASITGQN